VSELAEARGAGRGAEIEGTLRAGFATEDGASLVAEGDAAIVDGAVVGAATSTELAEEGAGPGLGVAPLTAAADGADRDRCSTATPTAAVVAASIAAQTQRRPPRDLGAVRVLTEMLEIWEAPAVLVELDERETGADRPRPLSSSATRAVATARRS
jgi:hypothetical protein